IDTSKLPATTQDDIRLTHCLGIRYIWIDVLCIAQNSREDWEKQSAKMNLAYSLAYLAFALPALLEPAGDFPTIYLLLLSVGALGTATGLTNKPYSYADMENVLADQPLSSGGWTVQERLLSLRKVHFTSQQIIWQWPSLCCFGAGMKVSPEERRGFSASVLDNENPNQSTWRSVVFDYAQCTPTRCSDQLPALSGVARIFADALKDDYFAGHWRETQPHPLIW
ncbi:hypothetical protein BDZ45DRAFT_546215, partial [Acephala macrosclerotiorum]